MESIPDLVEKLATELQPWRSYVIAVDGRDGVGKSPLARKLSFELKVPLVETDLFLVPNSGEPKYRKECLTHVIEARLDHNRPVIVEGIFVRRLLKSLCVEPNFVVHVTSDGCEGSYTWSEQFEEYEAEFEPSNVNHHVNWRCSE